MKDSISIVACQGKLPNPLIFVDNSRTQTYNLLVLAKSAPIAWRAQILWPTGDYCGSLANMSETMKHDVW
jgi:hypothetical protein